ncbi:MAG TPA: C40 family peptidase [Verrucomicrobiota bacterium]|nr:C40 family peptidase [Verrucomicrobiota bacterium]HNU51434.1 C40 family peptidase [Verrucomicrobiota bacterium]
MQQPTPASLAALLAVALGAGLVSCSSPPPQPVAASPAPPALERALQSVRATHAPDPHLAIFRVGATYRGSTLVLTGDVATAAARTDALAAARAAGFHARDDITVLPEPALGEATWGLVCLSVATGRELPDNPAEMGTQELMGHPLRVWKRAGNWYLVQTADRYVAWMEEGSFQPCTAAELNAWNQSPLLLVTAFEDQILEAPHPEAQPVSDVVMGGLVKKTGETGDWLSVELPDRRTGYLPKPAAEDYAAWKQSRQSTPEAVERTARSLLGRPYLWGANSPKAFDCSGFTKFVFFLNGVSLDRNASHQARQGVEVPLDSRLARLNKGDLLFFGRRPHHGRPERVIHTGIYLGGHLFIHASDRVRISSLDPASPLRDEHRIRTLIHARRVLPAAAAPSHDLIIRNGQGPQARIRAGTPACTPARSCGTLMPCSPRMPSTGTGRDPLDRSARSASSKRASSSPVLLSPSSSCWW